MNEVPETRVYDGIEYEIRSIAEGELGSIGASRLRPGIEVHEGDQLFFVDPRPDPSDPHHMSLVTVKSKDLTGITIEERGGYIYCCYHRVISVKGDVPEDDFNEIFE